MTVRIAMWSGPRNLSTALMRSWENRADTSVLDEPLYASYLKSTGLEHPGRADILASQPTDWTQAIATLMAPCATPVQYQKHMAHHVPDDADLSWMAPLRHVFLIRHPAQVLASYVRRRDQVTAKDLGYLQQIRLIRHLRDSGKRPLFVLDSADLLRGPERQLRVLCLALNLPFDPAMLRWPAGPRDSDGVWAPHWYDAVRTSTEFAPYQPQSSVIAPRHQAVLRTLLPYWHQLKAWSHL